MPLRALSFNTISSAAPQRMQRRAAECKLRFTRKLQLSLISDSVFAAWLLLSDRAAKNWGDFTRLRRTLPYIEGRDV